VNNLYSAEADVPVRSANYEWIHLITELLEQQMWGLLPARLAIFQKAGDPLSFALRVNCTLPRSRVRGAVGP
jgi:hypothetical protein